MLEGFDAGDAIKFVDFLQSKFAGEGEEVLFFGVGVECHANGGQVGFVLGGCHGGIVCHHFITEGMGEGIA